MIMDENGLCSEVFLAVGVCELDHARNKAHHAEKLLALDADDGGQRKAASVIQGMQTYRFAQRNSLDPPPPPSLLLFFWA